MISASVTTVKLKPLVSAQGRKGLAPEVKVANRKKVRVAGPRPVDFWVGATVKRRFRNTWFLGTVFDMVTDEGRVYFKVQYKDGDQEELDLGELWDSVIYHPRMDTAKYVPAELPKLHEVVLFADGQQPKVGEVEAVDENEHLPVTLSLWRPSSKANSLATARFAKDVNENAEGLIRVRPEQILLQQLKLNSEGFFDQDSRKHVQKLLRKPRTSTKSTATAKVRTMEKPKTTPSRPKPSKKTRIIRSRYRPDPARPRTPAATAPKQVHARYHLRRR